MATQQDDRAQAGDGKARPEHGRSRTALRDNLESIAIAVLMVLVLRQVVVEAFRIEHGSMAPTLVGTHQEVRCPNCGWVFDVGSDKGGLSGDVECPNCRRVWNDASASDETGRPILFKQPAWLWHSARAADGATLDSLDVANRISRGPSRIFVNKFIYKLRTPRRWEVSVFLFPEYGATCLSCGWKGTLDQRDKMACARCGSTKLQLDSRDFIKRVAGLPGETISLSDGDVYVNGLLERKPPDVQEKLWQHVFDSAFVPAREVRPTWNFTPMPERWTRRADGSLLLNARDTGASVMAAFAPRIVDFYPYDGLSQEALPHTGGVTGTSEVGDCRISARVRLSDAAPEDGEVLLAIEDAGRRFVLRVPTARSRTCALEEDGAVVAEAPLAGVEVGKSEWVTLENYDDRIVAGLGGREVLRHDYEPEVGGRKGVQFGARGADVLYERIIIERDVYYAYPRPSGNHPYQLGGDEYFMLGDNNPASSDSRSWEHPGVPEENLIGTAVLVYWPVQQMKSLWTRGTPAGR